ncbi:hypothetical protein Tco_1492154 [Tanacetum coccineum]
MLRLQALGSNTLSGVPYTEEEINALAQKGKQRGHLPDVGRVLPGWATNVLIPPPPPSPQCTHNSSDVEKLKKKNKYLTKQVNLMMKLFRRDDEMADDEDGGEDEEDEEDGDSWRCYIWRQVAHEGLDLSLGIVVNVVVVVDRDGHLRSCPSVRRGSLTEKLLELGDALGRHKVDIACFQETNGRAARLKDNVVHVSRSRDRIMEISVVIDGETVNIISAYASQVDLNDAATLEHARTAGPSQVRHTHRNTETFRATTFEILSALEEDISASNADQMESWWFNEEVQTKVAAKKYRLKELLLCREGHQEYIDMAKEKYKLAKREAKIVVAQAKDKAYKDLYKKLDSKDRANDRYKIAKAQERRRRDLGNVRYIKDEGGRTIVMEEYIRKRWG